MSVIRLWGRSRAFHEKLEQSRGRLYRMAYSWCRNPSVADDLVQDTLSKALRNAAQLRDLETMHSWLFTILANCTRDHFRQQRVMENIHEMEDQQQLVSDLTPETECAQNEVVRRVRSAVAGLPLAQRQVVVLVDLEEFSYSEVAQILDIPIGTVMSRLARARQALKAKLLEPVPARAVSVAATVVRLI